MHERLRRTPRYLLLPIGALFLFVLFYMLAAAEYSGGSWVNPRAEAFSLRDNYYCDLLDTRGIDGAMNPARHWARASLGVLCLGLAFLWYHLPALFQGRGWRLQLMRYAGILALCIPLFLRPGIHDIVLRPAGALGAIALFILIRELFRARYRILGLLGIVCLLLLVLNYALYETGRYLETLPMVQKATFACFLAWFTLLNLRLYQQVKQHPHRDPDN